ncbi:hypothetical protein [Paraburkholderia graminis]|uniref:Uncharacterized protein n=1 Tax=Paraburkholderia graminis TaxID=60548 RepID=A0ABD5CPN3_9BURK|nr:hypothetical protein [Paraburkholderia graminis]MDR6206973.1 hypothetical protein [Paraburkholderia graminis]
MDAELVPHDLEYRDHRVWLGVTRYNDAHYGCEAHVVKDGVEIDHFTLYGTAYEATFLAALSHAKAVISIRMARPS